MGYRGLLRLPRVDAWPLAGSLVWWRSCEEAGDDPAPGLGGVDDLVGLDVGGGVDRLAFLVVPGDHLVVVGAALGRIGDRLELLAVAELDGALEAHRAELAGRPGDREHAAVEVTGGHGDRAEAVGLAQ